MSYSIDIFCEHLNCRNENLECIEIAEGPNNNDRRTFKCPQCGKLTRLFTITEPYFEEEIVYQ